MYIAGQDEDEKQQNERKGRTTSGEEKAPLGRMDVFMWQLAERIHERMNGLMKGREHKDTMWERENRGIIWEIIICFSTAIVVANNNKLEACSSS